MKAVICLLRNDLRVHDNEILFWGNRVADFVIPVYCFDPRHYGKTYHYKFPKTGPHRLRFLLESIQNLRSNLEKRGSGLIVRFGRPEEVVPKLVKDVENVAHVTTVALQKEVTDEEIKVEKNLAKAIHPILTKTFWGATLFHKEDLPFGMQRLPDTYTGFRKIVEKDFDVRPCFEMQDPYKPLPSGLECGPIPTFKDFEVTEPPSDPRTAFPFSGGETAGQQRVSEYLWDTRAIATYKQTRNGLIGSNYSTKFSPWLAHGCLSPRYIYQKVREFEEKVVSNESTYWVLFELEWRDYFRYVCLKYGNQIFQSGGIQGKNIPWKQNKVTGKAWTDGMTGVPFVDANMRELLLTGWMSNRGRQNVASFLTKDLSIDWRFGAEWFESMLIDHDVCSNYGNWNYSAGIGNDPRENRKFNMIKQGLDYDDKGEYIKTWCPELKEVPPPVVHFPWTLPSDVRATYVPDGSYPKPIHVARDWERHYKRKSEPSPSQRQKQPNQQKRKQRGMDFYFSSSQDRPR